MSSTTALIDPATDPVVLTAAMDVSFETFIEPDPHPDGLRDALVQLAASTDDPNLRSEALQAARISEWAGDAATEALLVDSIASPDLALKVIAMSFAGPGDDDSVAEPGAIVDVLIEAASDERWEVRSVALRTLDRYAFQGDLDAERRDAVLAVADAARLDPVAVVRSNAIRLFAELQSYAAIPVIVNEHLDDNEELENTIVVRYRLADGSEMPFSNLGGPESVTSGALLEMQRITRSDDFGFDYSENEWEDGDDAPSVAEQVAAVAVPDAREWYAENEAAIAALIAQPPDADEGD